MATQLLPERFPLAADPLLASARTRVGYVLQVLALAAACMLGAWVGRNLAGGLVVPLWPPYGVAVAGLILLGPRFWPGITLGSLGANFGQDPSLILPLAAAATLAALLPALILPRLGWEDVTFQRLRDVLRFLAVAAVVAPLVGAVLTGLILAGHMGTQFDGAVVVRAYLGDLSSVVLVGTLLLTWLGAQPALPPAAGRLELLAMAGGLVGLALLTQRLSPLYFVPTFPLLAWAALRAGPRGSTLVSLSLFATTLWATSWGQAMSTDPDTSRLLFFTGLNMTQGVTGLLLAASVAERRQADQVEREVKDAYRALVAAAPFAVVGLDRSGRVTVWSRAAEVLFGWPASEVVGRTLPTIPPDRREELARTLAGGGQAVSGQETVRRTRDGVDRDVQLTSWPVYDGTGRFSGAMEVHQDITERKRAERLQLATYRISEAALTAPDLGQLYSAIHGIVSELMPARNLYIALYDQASDTLHFPYWSDERDAPPAARQARNGLTEYVIRTGHALRAPPALIGSLVERGEVEFFGSTTTDWLGVPLRARDRTIGALAVQSYDPSVRYTDREQAILEFVSSQVGMAIERKQAEDAVRASEKELRALFAAMRDVILVIDRTGRYLRVAPTSPDLLVVAAADLVGRRFHDVLPQAQADRFLEVVQRTLASGQPTTLEYQLGVQGRGIWFSAAVSPLDGDTVLWVARSINEQKQAEEALRRSEEHLRQALKMEAVGRLAGGVAHDFNNLLTSILGHADLALNRLVTGDPLYDDLLEIKSAGARAASLTQQLLAFSRKQVLEPRVVDLNAVVSGIARMLRRTIGEDIELITRLAPDLGAVRADPVQMEQVLLNLAVNARDAMPNGGRLTIETSNVLLSTDPMVRVRVEDTGIGMTEEVRAHLFEPFYTTKDVGKGTGLGLATAYGIVQQSGGTITVASAPGTGTTFVVDLPLVQDEAPAPEHESVKRSGHGTETILLVEDEDAVRNLTRRVLEYHGYRVLSAPNGEAALEISRLHHTALHLLLTDIVMPGMSGVRLAETLCSERPELRILFMSGYAAATLEQKILLQRGATFLQKPFTSEQLTRRVREVLEQAERARH